MQKTIPFLAALLIAFSLSLTAVAKRGAPKDVPPVTQNGVTYTAPHEPMGCVVAKDQKKDTVLWTKQIYVVKFDADLEKDVQDCFITELKWADGKLNISNERGDEYQLNTETLALTVIKGSDVVAKAVKK